MALIRGFNDSIIHLGQLADSSSEFITRQLKVNDTGSFLAFKKELAYLDVENDDPVEPVFVRLGSIVGTTNGNIAVELKATEGFLLERFQMPSGQREVAFITNPGITVNIRVLLGLV